MPSIKPDDAPSFVALPVTFDNNITFTPDKPLTDYRTCHDGTPQEARIVYTCHSSDPDSPHDLILKIKVQVPGHSNAAPADGPSDTTKLEIEALRMFRDVDAAYAPHLLGFKTTTQGVDGPLPGGYVTYTLMNKVEGQTLFDSGFWDRGEDGRKEITEKFLVVLRSIYKLGMIPQDRALRNIMWDEQARTCSIIDFEMWKSTSDGIADETKELQRWGLARSPPQNWHEIWFEAEGA